MTALHLSYRPNDFDEVIGNEETVNSLKSLMERSAGGRPRVYLLHGPTGCGKTTLGRIIAKYVGGPPEIKGEVNLDFQEVNTSNNRGIDTARAIDTGMRFKPLNGDARVYLLDEVHQTTKDFQHAMLKPLEDTPEWVYFILCTTEPEKLLPTIRNRCTTFDVRLLRSKEIDKLLEWVLEQEGMELPEKARKAVIKAAAGSPRQALVILDQIIDLKGDDMEEAIHSIEIREQAVIDLCRSLLRGDKWSQVREILQGIEEEPEKVRRAVLGYITSVALGGDDKTGGMMHLYDAFRDPFFNTGRAGLIFACLQAVKE